MENITTNFPRKLYNIEHLHSLTFFVLVPISWKCINTRLQTKIRGQRNLAVPDIASRIREGVSCVWQWNVATFAVVSRQISRHKDPFPHACCTVLLQLSTAVLMLQCLFLIVYTFACLVWELRIFSLAVLWCRTPPKNIKKIGQMTTIGIPPPKRMSKVRLRRKNERVPVISSY